MKPFVTIFYLIRLRMVQIAVHHEFGWEPKDVEHEVILYHFIAGFIGICRIDRL